MTDYVSTRWYRAPELLLAKKKYSYAIDIWSVGCIFAELFLRQPLFQGSDNENQLDMIINFLGTPNKEDIVEMNCPYLKEYLCKVPPRAPIKFESVFKSADPLAIDLMRKMLCFRPSKRPSALDCLNHPYFADLHMPEDEPTALPISEYEFIFEKENLSKNEYKSKLINRINL